MTSSRGAWLSLLAALGVWLAWLASDILSRNQRWSAAVLFLTVLGLLLIGMLFVAWVYPSGLLAALNRLPGLPSGETRLDLAHSTLNLIADFPWTGGGLGSFGGLYSQYILVTPFFIYAYSHNFYLDIALEQGIFAALVGLGIFAGAGWLFIKILATSQRRSVVQLLAAAGLIGLAAVMLHGLMDDALYGMSATLLLFLLPGMAVTLTGYAAATLPLHSTVPGIGTSPQNVSKWGSWAALGGLPILIGLVILMAGRTWQAGWYADLGAVNMARHELAGWPLGKWNADTDLSGYAPAVDFFTRALSANPDNATAHYRLGLIALQGRQFETAQAHLERAFRQNPDHRGVRKSLAYVYVWNDHPLKAFQLLMDIREAEHEMGQYTIWWKQQGRQDLALKAKDMLAVLSEKTGAVSQEMMIQP
jgi:O-antigen ligase